MNNMSMNKKENAIVKRARLRRRKEHYKRMFRFTTALLIVMTIATFTLSIRSFARDRKSETPTYKYYTTYTVQSGDSLSAIANRYISDEYGSVNKYIAEVVSINHLISASSIDEGQQLILPYYSDIMR